MGNDYIYKKGLVKQKRKQIGASNREMGRLNLTNAADAMNERGEKADNPVVTNTSEILEQAAGEEVSRIRSEARIRVARTGKRKGVRRRQKEAQAGGKGKLAGRHSEGGSSGQAGKLVARSVVGGADKGTQSSRRSSKASLMGRKKRGLKGGSENTLKTRRGRRLGKCGPKRLNRARSTKGGRRRNGGEDGRERD